jgi:hydrogenase-4 component F
MGIISLGLGFGGIGIFAALFHTLNHSLAKTLSFCAAGRMGQIHGTHDMKKMSGSYARSHVWGLGLFTGFLSLIGVVPFALFMSEFQIVKASVDIHAYVRLGLLLAGIAVIFISMLRRGIALFYATDGNQEHIRSSLTESLLVFVPLGALLVLGLWMPGFFGGILAGASAIISVIPVQHIR